MHFVQSENRRISIKKLEAMSGCDDDNGRWPGAAGEIFSEHFARREWSLVQSGNEPF